jgi:hypothetical protein
MGCVEGCFLYSRVHRGGWCRQFVVLWSVFCFGEIFVCIESSSSSFVYFYVMSVIVAVCFLLYRIRVYFVGCAWNRRIVDYLFLCTLYVLCVLCLWIFWTVRRMLCYMCYILVYIVFCFLDNCCCRLLAALNAIFKSVCLNGFVIRLIIGL